MFPYICSFLLYSNHIVLVNAKRDITGYERITFQGWILRWYRKSQVAKTAKTQMAILSFLYCEEFVKTYNDIFILRIFSSNYETKLIWSHFYWKKFIHTRRVIMLVDITFPLLSRRKIKLITVYPREHLANLFDSICCCQYSPRWSHQVSHLR